MKKRILLACIPLFLIAVFLLLFFFYPVNYAHRLIDEGRYEDAYDLLARLDGRFGTQGLLEGFCFMPTSIRIQNSDGTVVTQEIVLGESHLPAYMTRVGQDETVDIAFAYNADGKMAGKVSVYANGTRVYTECVYGADGNLLKEVSKSENGILYSQKENVYDAEGKRVQQVCKAPMKGVSDYTYDAEGRLVKCVYSRRGGEGFTAEYEYGSNGEMKKYSLSYHDGLKGSVTLFYEANGKLSREEMAFTRGIGEASVLYTYDERGNLINKTARDGDGNEASVSVQYKAVYIPFKITEEEIEEMFAEYMVYY